MFTIKLSLHCMQTEDGVKKFIQCPDIEKNIHNKNSKSDNIQKRILEMNEGKYYASNHLIL